VGYGAPARVDLAVGPILAKDFPLVVNRAPMSRSLLGMSFLQRLDSVHAEGGKLVLRWTDQRQP
jgi:aspartyl protease family protein